MRFRKFFYLFWQNATMAFSTLVAHKLRSFLSVLGISIGIFSIVMVYTLIDSLEFKIKESLSSFGKSVVYVEVYPWETEDRKAYPWWRYTNRPDPTVFEMKQLQQIFNRQIVDVVAFKMSDYNAKLTNIENAITMTQVSVEGITFNFNQIQDIHIRYGRYFTSQEVELGRNVCVLGNNIAVKLFGNASNAVNQKLRFNESVLTVLGVMEVEGESMFSNSADQLVYVPLDLLASKAGFNTRSYNPKIIVKAKEGIAIDALATELKGTMRNIRKLKPDADDNFAINKVTFFIEYLRDFFKKVNLFGFIIGGFSLLVGGFGVANIMFVSVKERTQIIGVQKAIGAKSHHILQQFLTEAIVLCVMGGFMGMIGVYGLSFVVNYFLTLTPDFNFVLVLSWSNMAYGLFFSILTGILAGIIPAWFGAKMPPVEAIRAS